MISDERKKVSKKINIDIVKNLKRKFSKQITNVFHTWNKILKLGVIPKHIFNMHFKVRVQNYPKNRYSTA